MSDSYWNSVVFSSDLHWRWRLQCTNSPRGPLGGGRSVKAAPSVFVKKETNSMWWDGAMNARIFGQAAGPVTVKKLSDFIGETMIYYSYTVCSLEPVGPDTFGGIDRDTQTEIDGYKAQSSWRAESVAPGGSRILGQRVVFEGCAEGPRGAALLARKGVW